MVAADALARRARRAPDAPALALGARSWCAAELAAAVAAAAAQLRGRGLRPGDRVAITRADPAEQLTWLLAADHLDAVPAVIDTRWPRDQLAAALQVLDPAVVVAQPPPRAGRERLTDRAGAEPAGGWIGFSSGTAGSPRAVLRTRESWTASFGAFSTLTELTRHDTILIPGPLSSSLFSFGALHALAAGATVRLLTRWDPAAAAACEATVVHLVPTMLRDLLARADVTLRPRLIVSAGAKLPAAVEAQAGGAWPKARVLEYYGSSEQSFVTIRSGGDPATVGSAFPRVQVQLRGDVVWSRSPFTCTGYLGSSAGPLRRDGEWVSVGDRGRLDERGALTLLGRQVLVVGGTSVGPEEVEAVLRQAPGVADAVAVGVPHERLGEVVAAVIEARPGRACAVPDLRRFARTALSPAQRPRRWYVVPRLPRLGNGKPDRAAIAAAIATGAPADSAAILVNRTSAGPRRRCLDQDRRDGPQ